MSTNAPDDLSIDVEPPQMTDQQLARCKEIMENLDKKPIMNIFRTTVFPIELGKGSTVSFEYIDKRLRSGLFDSVDTWMYDMQLFFDNIIQNTENGTVRHSAAIQLQEYYYQMLEVNHPLNQTDIYGLSTLSKKLLSYYNSLQEQTYSSFDQDPTSDIFLPNVNPSIQDIIKNATRLRSADIMFRVGAFIFTFQPEVVNMSEELILNFDLILEQNIVKIYEFVIETLKKAAKGEIEIFQDRLLPQVTIVYKGKRYSSVSL